MTLIERMVPIGVAIMVVVVGLVAVHLLGPFYGASRFDPAYAYLFNGLGVLHGLSPGHVDHPGTTIQELAALTILCEWLGGLVVGARQSITDSVLSQPESYLSAINFVLIVVDAVALGLGVRVLIRRTGRVWLSLLAPAFLICSPSILDSLADVKPEPLLIALAVPVALLAAPSAQTSRRVRLARAALLGAALGAGIITKITFAPLALFVLALPEIGSIAVAAASAAVAMAVLTIPIWPALSGMLNWQGRLLTHQGVYGEGAPGLPTLDRLLDGVRMLLTAEPLLPIALVLLALVSLISFGWRDSERRAWLRIFLIALAVILCQVAVTAPRPSPHYVVPSLVVGAILAPLALHLGIRGRLRFRSAMVAALVLLGLLVRYGIGVLDAEIRGVGELIAAVDHMSDAVGRANCRLVPYYRFGSLESAMAFGNGFIGRAYSAELARLYPDFVSFNIWADRIEDFQGLRNETLASRQLAEGQPLCLIGSIDLSAMHKTDVSLLAQDGNLFLYGVPSLH